MILTIGFIILAAFSVGTYAYFVASLKDERNEEAKNSKITTCFIPAATTISNILDSVGKFNITDIYPGHKEVASFSVTASGNIGAKTSFQFHYNIKENELLNNIKVSVYKSDEKISVTNNYFACQKKTETTDQNTKFFEECEEKNLGELVQETILTEGKEKIEIGSDTLLIRKENQNKTRYYYVVIEFLNKENQNEVMSSQLNGNINVELTSTSSLYTECILNGADPVLKNNLIPVTLDEDGTVHVADTKKEWYSYEKQKWANAVILKNEEEIYEDVIPEDKIESYFVWIPKYRYQLWDLGNYNELTIKDEAKVHPIPILFGDYNTEDSTNKECTTPMESGTNGNCKIGDFMTHPAFLSIPSTGFWIGKFETSKSNNLPNNSINPEGIEIKPNQISWRNINVSKAFFSSYNYQRKLDSHMAKNTEWGAVAFLSHSKNGYPSRIRINNNSEYKTGFAAVKEPSCGYTRDNRECNKYGNTSDVTKPYNTEIGSFASTTGNITGVYDMNGGDVEYVMGVLSNQNGIVYSGNSKTLNSGFAGPLGDGNSFPNGSKFPESKYYDKYLTGTNSEFKRSILGDFMKEMGPFFIHQEILARHVGSWYVNGAYFIDPIKPWIVRGGYFKNGTEGGIFAFDSSTGAGIDYGSFRIVLTPSF